MSAIVAATTNQTSKPVSQSIPAYLFDCSALELFSDFAQADEQAVDSIEHIAAHGGEMLADEARAFLFDRIVYSVVE